MIFLRNRASRGGSNNLAALVDGCVDEIQSVINKISVSRSSLPEPIADYFEFDKDNAALYLHTIEGAKYSITITAV